MVRKTAPGLVMKARRIKRRFALLEEVAAGADALNDRLAKEAPVLSFDLDAVVNDAVAGAIARANRELDARQAKNSS